jgi:RND family efflux transporter MFP subunit
MNLEETGRRSAGRRWLAVSVIVIVLSIGIGGVWLSLRSASTGQSNAVGKETYYCPMHPSYRSDKPGNCPICSMKLVPLETAAPSPATGQPSGMAEMQPTAPPSATPGGAAPSIRIDPVRQQQIGVKFASASVVPATVEIRAVGKVAYDETRIAHVHTKVSGWIEDVLVNFVGAPVRMGQPLFTIYSPDLVAAQQEYLLALRGREELGASSFPRIAEGSRSLVADSRRRLELWDMTPGQIEALEKRGEVSRTVTIVSPVSGVVTERAAYHHGRYVSPDLDLYTIVDLSRVWVQAEVYEFEMPHVRVGQSAEVSLPSDPERPPLEGRVTFVSPVLDPTTRTVGVRLEFPNPDDSLKPESFVNVTLRRELGSRLVVPNDAVLDTGKTQYVFVDKGNGYLEPREVKTGAEALEGRVIAKGLESGERVVTAANFILDSESRLKGAFDAMTETPAAEAPAAGAAANIRAEVMTDPSPAKVGKNKVRAKVMDPSGQPIDDAEAEVRIFMPQMGSMAPMEAKAVLRPVGDGVYEGELDIPMAWTWTTTITVRKGGKVVGTADTSITAR